MQEALLHHIWKFRLFDMNQLKTVGAETIEIIHPGQHNTDSGPDFFNARIRINDTIWAGNVELHIKTSDWQKHHHQNDEAYDNVILHVVFENDLTIKSSSSNDTTTNFSSLSKQSTIPILELKTRISESLLLRYDTIMLNQNKIPCSGSLSAVDAFTFSNWTDRLLIERLELKTKAIAQLLVQNQNNWEETFYVMLARNFGFKINAVPFELLARSLPVAHLAKHKNEIFQIEALLYGQAGLLQSDFKDEYPTRLRAEYDFLKTKFGLENMDAHLWKFMRLRPVNFPTIRIAQFAQLIHNSSHLFSKLLDVKNAKQAFDLFDVKASDYWSTHFMFDKTTPHSDERSPDSYRDGDEDNGSKHLGKTSIENILINTVVPILFHYGKQKGIQKIQNRAFEFLESITAEQNNITKQWIRHKVPCENAYQAQALIQLYNFYCSEKKCLSCAIGNKILKSSPLPLSKGNG